MFSIEEEQNIRFQCIADGIPVPNIIWTRNGELISLNPRFIVSSITIEASYRPYIYYAVLSNLNVTNLHSTDAGNYTCTADNDAGRDFITTPFVLNVTDSMLCATYSFFNNCLRPFDLPCI